jgi:RNA polymerase sigma-54 factor
MAMTPRLEMRQGQSLVMTPQLQQAIKLLQFSAAELVAFVDDELERNPLLERPADDEAPAAEERETASAGSGEDFAAIDHIDADLESLHPDMSAAERTEAGAAPLTDWSKANSGKSLDDVPGFEDPLTEDVSLAQHLEAQMAAAGFDAKQRMIGAALIDQVDDWGYCRADPLDVAMMLGCAEAEILAVLTRMQGFEPTGIMARSISECLALQLRERDRFDPVMETFIAHIDLLGKGDLARLQAACSVSRDDLEDMIAEVRALTPKPGAAFGGATAQTITPDVYVRGAPDGSWHVELNSDALPRVLMNQRYYAQISKQAARDKDKLFLSECAANANWLIKSLDQRARTILKVAKEIVRQQDGFFANGIEHLRPLNLKMIATAIEMHESTVSRVTSNKYMATPRGVFEMKYFFTAAIQSTGGGESHSAEAVRRKIQKLVEAETPDEILSDDRIVAILREGGVDIARRTVAKYRESLRIPSSVERKRRAGYAR